MIGKLIQAYGRPGFLMCDAHCEKAWGINSRPQRSLNDEDEDDYVFFGDHEIGEAPAFPGTYEGADGKPVHHRDRLNKWCFRECERSVWSLEYLELMELPDMLNPKPNIPNRERNNRNMEKK